MWLFFGCRSESQDWIFRDEMEGFLAKGTLAELSTAFSRDASEKVYVQHRIKEHGAELSRLMLEEGAYVYVCGDGNAMAQGVHKALVEALVEHGGAGGGSDGGGDLIDVVAADDEEGNSAADEDADDEDWCDEDPSGAHSNGRGWRRKARDRWTAAALAKARERTRKHWSGRREELLQTYRGAYDKLQKSSQAVQINNYGSVVEVSTMLDGAHLALTTRVIHTVKHFLHLELEHVVAKMEHSKEAGKLADVDPKAVRRWINEELLEEELAGAKGISRRTVHKWMLKLGFRWSRHHKCVYVDGHNRPDIVTDRRSFVALLERLRHKTSIPVRVEETVMVATSRGEARRAGASDDSDVSGDERDSGARSETGDDEQIDGMGGRREAGNLSSGQQSRKSKARRRSISTCASTPMTTAKENDDGDHQWISGKKGSPTNVKGKGRAAHISDVIGVNPGQLQTSKEAWGMMQEDVDAGPGRSGKNFGRTEGKGEAGHKVKEVQDAVEALKTAAADCAASKTAKGPSTAAVIMTVGQQHDGYWTSDRICAHLP
eukprot:g5907.t1